MCVWVCMLPLYYMIYFSFLKAGVQFLILGSSEPHVVFLFCFLFFSSVLTAEAMESVAGGAVVAPPTAAGHRFSAVPLEMMAAAGRGRT